MSYFAAGTWEAIAVVVAAAGAGYGAYASYEAGQNQAALARYTAAQQASENQFKLQESAAKALSDRQENQRILAEQANAFAANGAAIDTGSPLLIQAKQASLLERKALNTDYEGAIASRFGQSQVTQSEMSADAASSAGKRNATSTLLQGASNTFGSVANYKLNS